MVLETKEIPKVLFLLICLGVSSYITVWLVTKIRNEISQTMSN